MIARGISFALSRFGLNRIWSRLLLVNLVVVLVPLFGIEFARIYERELLKSLEQRMRNHAALWRIVATHAVNAGSVINDDSFADMLLQAQRKTGMRVRILDAGADVLVDSSSLKRNRQQPAVALSSQQSPHWSPLSDRSEVRRALQGKPSAMTRIRQYSEAVVLFVSEPIILDTDVIGAIYVEATTRPVMRRLHRIRIGLIKILIITLLFSGLITALLAWSVSKPLSNLARSARQIATTRFDSHRTPTLLIGSGPREVRALAKAFDAMTQKLSAKVSYVEHFVVDFAHELKSPLTSIRGAVEILTDDQSVKPADKKRFLNNIRLDVERLTRLSKRLLALGRIESSSDARDVIAVAPWLRTLAERFDIARGPIVIDCAEDLKINARRHDMAAALTNMIENAIRYAKPGTTVTACVSQSHDATRFTVANQGEPIATGMEDRIFDRFYTTDRDQEGTGLGLAIVAAVAASHDGSVNAQSDAGQTTISLKIPRAQTAR